MNKRTKNRVSNEEFERNLNDKNLIRVMRAASMKYKSLLSEDEIYSCMLYALHYTLSNIREDGCKISTLLYEQVKRECIRYINRDKKVGRYVPLGNLESSYSDSEMPDIQDSLDQLPDKMGQIVYQHVVGGKTFLEISKELDISDVQVWRLYHDGISRLKRALCVS